MKGIVPEVIEDYRVFVNGSIDLVGIGDVELPSFKTLTETINGAGILGEIEVGVAGHFESQKIKINWNMITGDITSFYKSDAIQIDCRVSNQQYNTTKGKREKEALKVLVKGTVTNNELGKAAKKGKYEGSSEVEVLYIKIEIGGKTIIELDKINYIYIVDGVDQLAETRNALGI